MVGAAETVNVTGTVKGLLVKPAEVRITEPL
jgi:hypothetical protein